MEAIAPSNIGVNREAFDLRLATSVYRATFDPTAAKMKRKTVESVARASEKWTQQTMWNCINNTLGLLLSVKVTSCIKTTLGVAISPSLFDTKTMIIKRG